MKKPRIPSERGLSTQPSAVWEEGERQTPRFHLLSHPHTRTLLSKMEKNGQWTESRRAQWFQRTLCRYLLTVPKSWGPGNQEIFLWIPSRQQNDDRMLMKPDSVYHCFVTKAMCFGNSGVWFWSWAHSDYLASNHCQVTWLIQVLISSPVKQCQYFMQKTA